MPSVRSAALGFFVATGSRGEAVGEAGLSHFLEHLLFRGTDRYASAEIDQLFDGMGAELNAGTDKESTAVYARMLDQHLPAAFDVMADMVWRPAFKDVDPEREVVLEEIAMYEDDPQDTVFDVLGEAVFGTHPLGRPIIGRAPVIRDTPIDVIADFHARRYVPRLGRDRGGRVGRPRRDRRAGARARSASAPRSSRSRAPEPAPGTPGANVRFVRKDTEQVHVTLGGLGLQRGDDRRFAARVLDAIFGGLSSSRLFQAVREERGLAYSRLLVRRPVRRHGPGRPLRRHAPGQPRRGDEGRRRRARAPARAARHRGGARARARERQGPGRAGHGVHRRAHAPARRLAAVRPAAAGDRRGHGAHRRRDDGRHALAGRRAVGARRAVRGRHRPGRGRVLRRGREASRGPRRRLAA